MKSLLILLAILIFAFSAVFGKTTTAIVNGGDWTAGATWDNGFPADGDIINIPNGIAVIINTATINLRGAGVQP